MTNKNQSAVNSNSSDYRDHFLRDESGAELAAEIQRRYNCHSALVAVVHDFARLCDEPGFRASVNPEQIGTLDYYAKLARAALAAAK